MHLENRTRNVGLLFVMLPVAIAAQATAQRLQLAATPPPYYVSQPIQLQISASGFDEQPDPQCTIDGELPEGLSAQLVGIAPSVSQSISNINGRITRTRRVVFRFTFQVEAAAAGDYELGPWTVTQGDKTVRAEAVTLQFREIESDDNVRISLELPDQPVYQGQRVPVTVRFAYAVDLNSIRNLSIRAPLFDQFEFRDTVARQDDKLLPIQTSAGPVNLASQVTVETIDGREFAVITATRTLLADQPGTYHLRPITASLRKGQSRRSRDIFEEFFDDPRFRRRSTPSVPVRAEGQPAQLVIKPLPMEGRPKSFAGAVGNGFSLETQANRTVVRVGDPISLNLTIRGQGNLEEARLPPLSVDDGMSPTQFRLPNVADIAGFYQDNAKQFSVTLRVQDESVDAIPALAFSWFDPQAQDYRTTRSKPIALQVMPAQVVSSTDVVSGVSPEDAAEQPRENQATAAAASPGANTSVTAAGADFAIENNPDRLLATRGFHGWTTIVSAAVYAVGLLVLAASVVDRRRRQIDPEVIRRRQLFQAQANRLRKAAGLPTGRAAEEVATALRLLIPEAHGEHKRQVESLLARLEVLIFAPDRTDHHGLPPELLAQAQQLAAEIGKEAS